MLTEMDSITPETALDLQLARLNWNLFDQLTEYVRLSTTLHSLPEPTRVQTWHETVKFFK
jgi:hypothetical protein